MNAALTRTMQTLLDRCFLNREISLGRYLKERGRLAQSASGPVCHNHRDRPAVVVEDQHGMPLCGPCGVEHYQRLFE